MRRGKGQAIAWLRQNFAHSGDSCLQWPFSVHPSGYGSFGFEGKIYYAHRYMCQLAHGPAPTRRHEAAHTCGRGHQGCVNPRHLAWKTKKQNRADCAEHGTNYRNKWGNRGKLKPDQVRAIKDLKGKKTQRELAAMFDCSMATIEGIHNRRYHLD